MKLLTVIMGFLFLIGANFAQASDSNDDFKVSTTAEEVSFWIIENDS